MDGLRWDEEGLPFSAILEEKIEETGELRLDAEVKDSGMMLMNAVSPQLEWIQGTANIVLAVRKAFETQYLILRDRSTWR